MTDEDDDDSDDTIDSGAESDDADEAGSPHEQGAQTVRAWRKRLLAAALSQQHAEWSGQRDGYEASHGGTWGGSACLWVELNTGASAGNQSQWMICMRMLQSCQSQSARVAMIQIWAGVVPTVRSHLVVSNARKAAMPKAAKLQWVQCPCGAGPQDSAHLLHCVHKAVVEVRERAVELADIWIRDNAPARSQSADVFARSRTSWAALNQTQRALATLGSTGTGMNWHTRSAVVAAGSWQQLERAWTVVNTEP